MDYGALSARSCLSQNELWHPELAGEETQHLFISLINPGLSRQKSLGHVQDAEIEKHSDGSLESQVNMQVLGEKEL